jgi:hypothetical protein
MLSPGRRLALATVAVITVMALLVLGSAAVIRLSGGGTARVSVHADSPQPNAAGPVAAQGAPPSPNPAQTAGAAQDIALLTATRAIRPAASVRYPAINGPAKTQPDLYARAFVTRLLTQDYQRPRGELLAWVQYESAQSSEPRVVGLVPQDLRDKLAVYSLTESVDGSPVPIPSSTEWAGWHKRKGYTTVTVQKVSEPLKWSQAVADGQLTDPGATARDVDAQVVTHWMDGRRRRTSAQSVALSFNLEGPPAHSGYGFVTAVTYDAVMVS